MLFSADLFTATFITVIFLTSCTHPKLVLVHLYREISSIITHLTNKSILIKQLSIIVPLVSLSCRRKEKDFTNIFLNQAQKNLSNKMINIRI